MFLMAEMSVAKNFLMAVMSVTEKSLVAEMSGDKMFVAQFMRMAKMSVAQTNVWPKFLWPRWVFGPNTCGKILYLAQVSEDQMSEDQKF